MEYKIMAVISAALLFAATPAIAFERLPRGYLLAQSIQTYSASKFGAISTEKEAEVFFANVKGRVDGVELNPIYYDGPSTAATARIAAKAKAYNVEMWTSSFEMARKISKGSFGPMPDGYKAYAMTEAGAITPLMLDDAPYFDVLNPEAVTWFLKRYEAGYLMPLRGLVNGFFFNEDVITYAGAWENDVRYDYRRNASFSPAALKAWQAYCASHGVTYDGKIVDRFPVHAPEMVSKGKGQTAYFPGYDVPEKIFPGQRFIDMPRPKGVWRDWYDFLSEQFINNWIGRVAGAANRVNRGAPSWRGAIYFGHHTWSLPYEEIEDPEFIVPAVHMWGAWGRQRGMDLKRLSMHPEIAAVVIETYPPVAGGGLERFIKEAKRIVESSGKTFGVMLHRDDTWPLYAREEELRWGLIEKYSPVIIARYPLWNMMPGWKYYNAELEGYFFKRLGEYRRAVKR